jgi:hypothetical protein
MIGTPDIGGKLCEAWGLDPNRVTRIEIDIKAHEFPVVTVTLLGDPNLVELIADEFYLLRVSEE